MYVPAFTATCWYAGSDGTPPPGAYTNTFSIKNNMFLNVSPIDSVNPSGTWSQPASYVSSINSDVEITAKETMDDESFKLWFLIGQNPSNIRQIQVKKGATVYAIAIYEPEFKIHPKDWMLRRWLEWLESKDILGELTKKRDLRW